MDIETTHPDAKHSSSFSDENFDEKRGAGEDTPSVDGDVYNDTRAIDLDKDGKERPIGMSSICFARSLIF